MEMITATLAMNTFQNMMVFDCSQTVKNKIENSVLSSPVLSDMKGHNGSNEELPILQTVGVSQFKPPNSISDLWLAFM
jgi:hypothetical protein